MPKVVFGYFAATCFIEFVYAKPMPIDGVVAARARSLSFWTRSASVSVVLAVSSLTEPPNSFLALSMPRAAESLKEWSPRPPTS